MAVTATQVKELRERTGAGMMECKKALVETDGDLDAAIEYLRKTGIAKADKKAGRTAAEGRIALGLSEDGRRGVLVEVNCETDFVAKDANFVEFTEQAAALALKEHVTDVAELADKQLESGETVLHATKTLVAKLGENILLRRVAGVETKDGVLGSYLHGSRIGVLVALKGGDAGLARDLAMHVAASRPAYIDSSEVPAETLGKEREILRAQAEGSGKGEQIIEKMVEGRLGKYLAEITLLGQPFVKDPEQTVKKLLQQAGASVTDFARLEVGEGIERKESDFAREVMQQARG